MASDDRAVVLEDSVLRLAPRGVLANDQGRRLRAEVVSEPRDAALRLGARGGVRLRPDADVNGTVRFVYRAVAGNGRADRAVVRVKVVPVNDAPSFTAGPDQVVAAGAGPQVVPGWAADLDAGAPDEHDQRLTFEVDEVSDATLFAAGGLPTVTADGELTYTPAPSAHGTATARVVLTDDGGEADGGADTSTPASVRITVSPAAVPPVVRPGGGATTVLAGGSSALLAPDAEVVDPDSELTRATVTVAGGLVLTAPSTDGITASYDAGAGRLELAGRASDAAYQRAIRAVEVRASESAAPGPHPVLVELEDVDGLTGRAEREVRVEAVPPVDLPTVTMADAVTVDEDDDATGNVLANDTDPDDTLTVTDFTDADHGTLAIASDGAFTYTPDPDWHGTEAITYTTNTGATGTLTITVTPVRDAPVARDDSLTGDEDSSITGNVLANDTDGDGDSLVAVLVTGPAHGTLTLNANGSTTYTPSANFHGPDSFTYKTYDGSLQSNVATVTLTVDPVNDAPVAHDDFYRADGVVGVTADVLANDTDPDGDSLVATVTSPPSHGTLIANPAGSITYAPVPGYRGPDSFTYSVSDGDGSNDTATVTFLVTEPTVTMADSVTVAEDDVLTGNVLTNDTDPDDTLTVTDHTDPAHGTLTIESDGDFTYTPDPNWHGTESVTYTTNTGATGTLDVTVTPVNDAPVAHDDSFTTNEDVPLVLSVSDVLGNDTDVDGDTVQLVAILSVTHGAISYDSTTITYYPDPNFSGSGSFAYMIGDGHGGTSVGAADLAVTPVDDATLTADDVVSVAEDTAATGNVLTNDTDPDDTLNISGHAEPAHGTLTIESDGAFTYTPDADWHGTETVGYTTNTGALGTLAITVTSVNDAPVAHDDSFTTDEDVPLVLSVSDVLGNDTDVDGDTVQLVAILSVTHGAISYDSTTITYYPDPNFSGTGSFQYRIRDGQGGTAVGAADLTVTPVDDPTVTAADTVTVAEDTTATGNVLTNDTDPDGLTVTDNTAPDHGSLTIEPDGDFTYTPDPDWNGTETVTYTTDTGATDTLDVTVTPVADAPVAHDDSYTTAEETPLLIRISDVLANDTDGDGDALDVVQVSGVTHGTVFKNASMITFVPSSEYSGPASFSYQIDDGNGGTAVGTVHVTVTRIDDATVVVNDFASAFEGGTATGNVLANDTDRDDTLTVTGHTAPGTGTLTMGADGGFTFTPEPGWTGTVLITYTTNTGATGRLAITIMPVP